MFNQIAKDLFLFLRVPHIALALIVALLIRWLMSSTIPLGHDETYYWDWGRNLQWSYYDHPPGVAWLRSAGTGRCRGRGAALGSHDVLGSPVGTARVV